MTASLVKGSLIRWRYGPSTTSIGTVLEAVQGGRHVRVRLDSGQEQTFVSDALERVTFAPGSAVEMIADHSIAVVTNVIDNSGVLVYQLALPGGIQKTVLEDGLRPAVIIDPVALLRAGEIHNARSCNLRLTATRLLFAHQFDDLSSLSNSRVEIKPHQVGVLHRVASTYPHRFLLADEVGLGKTIEAGLVIKELKARRVANRVLVLAPSGIVSQWQFELKTKFNEIFAHYKRESIAYLQSRHPGENVWTLNDNIIASTSYAAWDDRRRREIALAGWDLVVIDEAHHARRQLQGDDRYSETKLYRLADMIADRAQGQALGILLLTATPMQLHRFELYSLIELLDPALFSGFRDFEVHCDSLSGLNVTVDALQRWHTLEAGEQTDAVSDVARWLGRPTDTLLPALATPLGQSQLRDELLAKHRLSEVMVRNRKAVVGGFMPRVASVWPVTLTPQERNAYDASTEYVRSGYARSRATRNNALGFLMAILQKLNSSSSYALRQSLLRRIDKLRAGLPGVRGEVNIEDEELEEQPLADALGDTLAVHSRSSVDEELAELERIVGLLDAITIDSKTKILVERLNEIAAGDSGAKVIIFTQFRDTQEYLRRHIPTRWRVEVFHGQLKPDEKDAAVSRFRGELGPSVLVSTEAGGEGRNFQFCHILINYDLPWNPMKIEQRIGRLDRVGQKSPVMIINFSILGTIEERVLEVLTRRIRVFEETIGGLDPILGDVENDLRKIFLSAATEGERALERLGQQLETRVRAAREAERRLADLIMDTKSFRQDEVHALLERKGVLDSTVLKGFVLGALDELGVQITKAEISGVYELRFRSRFLREYPHFGEEGVARHVTFDPSVALDYETIDFLAFGHELVDALVTRVRDRGYRGCTSHRCIATDEQQPAQGWFFAYVLEFEGVVGSKEVLPVFVHLDGRPDPGLARWLLDRAGRIKREECGERELPTRGETFERAVALANEQAVRRLLERQAELAATNRERLEQERTKLEKFYQYRERAAHEKRDTVQKTFERLSTSDDPDVQRILPVWAKNLENAKAVIDTIGVERERRFGELVGREQVTAQHEIFTASFVEIVAESTVAEIA